MTNREFINKLSNEEFAQTIIDDVILHMACVDQGSGVNIKCANPNKDCMQCIVRLLESDVEG